MKRLTRKAKNEIQATARVAPTKQTAGHMGPTLRKRRNNMKKVCAIIGVIVSAVAVLLMCRKNKEEHL